MNNINISKNKVCECCRCGKIEESNIVLSWEDRLGIETTDFYLCKSCTDSFNSWLISEDN